LKSTPGPAIRTGWLRAILLGHQRVAAGLGIGVPILVLASTTSDFSRRWHDGLRLVDTVLDVEQTAARAVRLGAHITVVRIPEGLHDLTLSAPHVRKQALEEIGRFVEAYVKRGPSFLDGSVGGGARTD
jgi:alpha-beta hydrolase superfamily lysophospholipase